MLKMAAQRLVFIFIYIISIIFSFDAFQHSISVKILHFKGKVPETQGRHSSGYQREMILYSSFGLNSDTADTEAIDNGA